MMREYRWKVIRRLQRYKKQLIFSLRKPYANSSPIFIMGYGRSGTSMMVNVCDLDGGIDSRHENDPRVHENYMLVPEKLCTEIEKCKANVLVMKPILDSFHASRMLTSFRRAKIIWMLRNYQDVTASSIRKWGPLAADYMKDLVSSN